ncbi:MAG: hypothetical protein A2Y37_09750 [Spirochaetes bacterium GWB1_60_80]|nr:MAG: hypothetical protein A2Y37_09750 [Spirochaetes bacterium GWB1_60_80]OHD41489.1 MAG: hypothetical protein A2Y35_06055 [Spirochaetes bacterium GWE1_60_18]OHD61391.1 MAG: hypothetical protein A2Y32_04445 [Spirochaetes bacterium GWF1_60_12]HAX36427.1 hypothetical protein [Spirochaetaceae bacterium]HBO39827.1 hypothetical protein [Spirochaetaceae bacterium]
MLCTERFSAEAIALLRHAIEDAKGNEVFAAGKLDGQGLLIDLAIVARGSKTKVNALTAFLEEYDVLVHNHPSGTLIPSEADMAIAAKAGETGTGSYIVDNMVDEVYVVAEPVRRRPLVAINPEELAGVLRKDGKLARLLTDYEPRDSQIELVKAIANAMNEGIVLAAEAGTGVGKSFAYLIPAFAWVIRNRQRIVVSTATINLQKQLMDKDIPRVGSIFKKQLKAVLVKGRGNYLCFNRLMEALDEEGLFADDEHPLKRITRWSDTSETGDRADLSFWPEDSTWSRVCAEADNCLGLRCAYRESCFILRMKKNCADADILVANHHILFSDLAARMDGAGYDGTVVLPPFQTIIFDEAHAIESSASSFFAAELAKFAVFKQLSRLYREKRDRKFGILTKLQNLQGIPQTLFKRVPDAIDQVRACIDYADDCAQRLLGDSGNLRLLADSPAIEELIYGPLGALERALLALTQLLKDIIDEVDEPNAKEMSVYETSLALTRLSAMARLCARFRSRHDEPENIFWLEKGRTGRDEAFAILRITPLDITKLMNEAVFEPYRCCICVSATLTVDRRFDFWKKRVGLNLADCLTDYHILDSPFPYRDHALLASPPDAPFPNDPGWQAYINQAVSQLLEASGGHALVLFTSYASLRACWDEVQPLLDRCGISALRQGDDERSRLLERFKTDHSSVLFATDSFWEGVDAPGSTLQLVIITKLPFRVPTDPVQMARAEAIERRGGNAFADLSLPEAVIRLKQGFGRLIRHSDDYGAVAILDARLLKKQYGKIFLSSLPETATSFKPLAGLCEDVRGFLQTMRRQAFDRLEQPPPPAGTGPARATARRASAALQTNSALSGLALAAEPDDSVRPAAPASGGGRPEAQAPAGVNKPAKRPAKRKKRLPGGDAPRELAPPADEGGGEQVQ